MQNKHQNYVRWTGFHFTSFYNEEAIIHAEVFPVILLISQPKIDFAEGPNSPSQQARSSNLCPVHEKCYAVINVLENHVFHLTNWVGKI